MFKILKIEQNPKRRELFYIFLNDGRVLELKYQTIQHFKLFADDIITEKQLNLIMSHDNYEKAKDIALKFLAKRSRTKYEIYKYLRTKGFQNMEIFRVLLFCYNKGLINDYEYAKRYTLECINSKKDGLYKIRRKLLEKGISKKTVNRVLKELVTEDNQLTNAFTLAQKKLKLLSGKSNKKEKLYRYLLQKGFPKNVIFKAINHFS